MYNKLKCKEAYTDVRVPAAPFFVRLDGWRFHSLTEKLKLKKPFDRLLAECMIEAVKNIFRLFNPALAYLFSDEISILFPKTNLFGLRVEKIDSILAGFTSSGLHKALTKRLPDRDVPALSLDCRIIPMKNPEEAVNYLTWRQSEAYRNCYNSYAYQALIRKAGLTPQEAAQRLKDVKLSRLMELIKRYGIDLNLSDIPRWHERGILIHWETYKKMGYDPVRGIYMTAERRRLKVEWFLPSFIMEEGRSMLRGLLRDVF
ncbi:tRNA 5'-guanylyltransferase [Candidatus Bathyarchaeota archaeon]|nr:MAG: tRNA 5'-guanylyltransferase [Candidatus Bathyarchaeota archaeon]